MSIKKNTQAPTKAKSVQSNYKITLLLFYQTLEKKANRRIAMRICNSCFRTIEAGEEVCRINGEIFCDDCFMVEILEEDYEYEED